MEENKNLQWFCRALKLCIIQVKIYTVTISEGNIWNKSNI